MNQTRNYEAELASFTTFQRDCYSAILSKSDYILDKIIKTYRSNIGSLLCDLPKIENYFYEPVENSNLGFEMTRFDMMTIGFINDNKNLYSFVESKITNGKSPVDAIVETFIDCGLNSSNGQESSRFNHMIQHYKAYIMRNNRLYAI